MSTDIKLSNAQLFKIIESGGFLGTLLGKLAGPMMKFDVLLAKNVLAPLATMASATAIDGAIQKKMRVLGIVRAVKGITLVISNEDMDEIIRIAKLLQNSGIWIDGVSETVKRKIKKQESGFIGILLETLGASLLGNMFTAKEKMRTEKAAIRAETRSYINHLRQNL